MSDNEQPDTGGQAEVPGRAGGADQGVNLAAQGVDLAQHPILQHVPFPEKLDLSNEANRPEVWKLFRQVWDNYEISSNLVYYPSPTRAATLLTCFKDSALRVFNAISFENEDDKKDITVVLQKMTEACTGTVNVTYERYIFNTRTQSDSEPIMDYYAVLLKLSRTCEFETLRDSLIRDRIIVGMRDKAVRKRLLLESKLTLKRCLEISRSCEATNSRLDAMGQNTSSSKSDINRVKSKYSRGSNPNRQKSCSQSQQKTSRWKPHSSNSSSNSRKVSETNKCEYCGANPGHSRSECPASNAVCSFCNRRGHYAAVCRRKSKSSKKKSVAQVEFSESDFSDSDDFLFLGSLFDPEQPEVSAVDVKTGYVTVKVDQEPVTFRIDTGADVNIISKQLYDSKFSHMPLLKAGTPLRGPNQGELITCGFMKCDIKFKDKCVNSQIYIMKDAKPLLSKNTSLDLNLINFVGNTTETTVQNEFPLVFKGLGAFEKEYEITVDSNVAPYAVLAPRRIPIPLTQKVKEELDRLESLDVVRRITEPTDWCSPLVVVPKKDSKSVRLCVDYTRLNLAVKRERHILPSVDHTLGQLKDAKISSKLDANSGFHQIKLSPASQLLTTFITPFGRYCYNRMPFGINSGPEHFQMQIHRILEGIPGVACLMDDLVVFGSTVEEHDARLKTVLQRLQEAHLTLNTKKCVFHSKEIKFLGHKICDGKLMADDDKTKAIMDMDAPTNVSEIRRFFGMVNQLAKFVPDLATHTAPLRSLLSERNEWTRGQAQAKAFKHIKTLVCSPQVLVLYDSSRPTKVSADSSSYGLGAVLQQLVDNVWRPVAFASRSLTETESRYAMVEKEALASAWACTKFSDYLIGLPKFSLETDHKPLLALLGSKPISDLPPRIQRIRMRLMRFNYDISHTAGKDLHTADALSRAPVSLHSKSDAKLSKEIVKYAECLHAYIPATDARLDQVRNKQSQDPVCSLLKQYVSKEWPSKHHSPAIVCLLPISWIYNSSK